ncbi:hypothetical protein J6590_035702 [Homalodisca vitripennis]|nr:hypothetical protein J6590_035702 [Homalodisca vitripennis]
MVAHSPGKLSKGVGYTDTPPSDAVSTEVEAVPIRPKGVNTIMMNNLLLVRGTRLFTHTSTSVWFSLSALTNAAPSVPVAHAT